jgi:hypothetical protein
MRGPSQRSLYDNTNHPEETDIHSPGGIRTRILSKRAVEVPRRRPSGHWDRHMLIYLQPLTEYKGLILTNCHQNLKNSLTKICSSHLSSLQLPARRQLHSYNLTALQQLTPRGHFNKMVTLPLNSFHYDVNIWLCMKCMNVPEVSSCEYSCKFYYFFRTFPET